MSSDIAGGGLKQIKTSIDQVLSILLAQSTKQSENELLLRSLASKFDVQGQRLMLLESDLKVVKERLEQKSEISSESPSRTSVSHPTASDQSTNTNILHVEDRRLESIQNDLKVVKEIVQTSEPMNKNVSCIESSGLSDEDSWLSVQNGIIQAVHTRDDGIKSFVKQETRRLTDVVVKCSVDVMTKVHNFEKNLSRLDSELKQVVRCIEELGRGVRAVDHSTSVSSQVIQDIQDHLPPIKELKTAVQALVVGKPTAAVCQEMKNEVKHATSGIEKLTEKLGQIMSRTELDIHLSTLRHLISKNLSSIEYVHKELDATMQCHDQRDIVENIRKRVERGIDILEIQNQQIFDQTLAECQIIREMVTLTRKDRDFYKCDFFVRDFSKCRDQCSQSWFIDQLNTHVKGRVRFEENNTKMSIHLVLGRYPRTLGLNTQEGDICSVRVKLVKDGKKSWQVGYYPNCEFDEKKISCPTYDGWDVGLGYEVAFLSCHNIVSNRWVDGFDRVLIRYELCFD